MSAGCDQGKLEEIKYEANQIRIHKFLSTYRWRKCPEATTILGELAFSWLPLLEIKSMPP